MRQLELTEIDEYINGTMLSNVKFFFLKKDIDGYYNQLQSIIDQEMNAYACE